MKSIKEMMFNRSKKDPNILGELLRGECFVPDQYGNDYGCYSTFDLTEDFKPVLPDTDKGRAILDVLIKADSYLYYEKGDYSTYLQDVPGITFFSNGAIDIAWYWDGDGTLLFISHELQKAVVNSDCKKDYCWRFVNYKENTNG